MTALNKVNEVVKARQALQEEVSKQIFGQEKSVDLIFISLLCKGHTLLHGLPGLGKTKLARTISQALSLDFSRIQFTPDLMPSDITGTEIIDEDTETGKRFREFLKGPVFSQLILADEINRTPPKTQAALLQAMQEGEVSVGRETFKLPQPFMVLATENPVELEGTYVLPEAQLDRFMFSVVMEYPSLETELEIVKDTTGIENDEVKAVLSVEDIEALRQTVREIPISEDVMKYAIKIVQQTRVEHSDNAKVKQYVQYGASPRASQNIILGAKALALLEGRCHVNFEDIQAMAHPVLGHRVVLNFRSKADKVEVSQIIDEILQSVRP